MSTGRFCPLLALFLICLFPGRPALAETTEITDLKEQVDQQDVIIERLEKTVEQLLSAQSDQGTSAGDGAESDTTAAVSQETADYVDARIEEFESAPQSRFLISGYGVTEFVESSEMPSSFLLKFNPSFHFRMAEILHFNGELELEFERSDDGEAETEIGLEFAQSDLIATDWLVLSAGKFLLPFNTFGPRLHPQWINKMATAPLFYGGHDGGGLIPVLADVGLMASGGAALWNDSSKFNYAFFVANGPNSEEPEGGGPPDQDSLLDIDFDSTPDLNGEKSFGGRLGFLPIPNLEIGASYLTTKVSNPGSRVHLAGADLWYLAWGIEFRGEFMNLSRDAGGIDADVWAYSLQASYRLRNLISNTSGLHGLLGRFEPVIRWGEINDLPTKNREQVALGLNFWIFESAPLRITYELNSGAVSSDRIFAQFAYGF